MKDYTEYSVDVRLTDTNKFVRQINIFDTYEQAEAFVRTVADKLPEDQEYTIRNIPLWVLITHRRDNDDQ